MMSCHVIPTWPEWNLNPDDIMMMWLTLYVNHSDIMSGMHMHASVLYVELAHPSN